LAMFSNIVANSFFYFLFEDKKIQQSMTAMLT